MQILTAEQFATKHGVSQQKVREWAQAGRLPGSVKFGSQWAIPATCPRPEPMAPGRKPQEKIEQKQPKRRKSLSGKG